MKLDKLELSAILGISARNRELAFMMQQIQQQIEQLNEESKELFSDIEIRLKLEPDTLVNYDVDATTGELVTKQEESEASFGEAITNGIHRTNGRISNSDDITVLEDVD
jgi:hypothetical protein